MEKQTFSTSMAPDVTIEQILGNLTVKGWDEPQVVIRANPEDLSVEEQDDAIRLSCQGECDLRLPLGAILSIGSVSGGVRIKNLEDQLAIEQVHGSVSLRNVAAVQVDTIHGELAVRYLTGDLEVGQIHGNARVREVQGTCTLEEVAGNADLRNIESDLKITAGGNVHLRLNVILGSQYHIQAGGNLNARIPEDVSLELSLSSQAHNIKVRLPDGAKAITEEQHEMTLMDGDVDMTLNAGGNLYLVSEGGWEDMDLDDFELIGADFSNELSQQIAQQIESQIQSQVETMTSQINDQVIKMTEQVSKAGLSPEETERLMEQARKVSEIETERTQENMRKAREKLKRKIEASRRKHELKAQAAHRRARVHSKRTWGIEFPSPPPTPDPVSEEERLMILNMLEQKKISLDEAEQLLSALEGRES
jgi:hypothetical protein